jgi:glycosyltransferase involved in cell wall biosynthesis
MTHDKDIHGRDWRSCSACPHPTPDACPSRAHRAFCVRLAEKPATWASRIAAMPPEDREPAPLLPDPYAPPPPFRRDPGRLSVGFAGPCYYSIGGTEEFHRALLPRLAARGLHVVGYAVHDTPAEVPIPGVPVAGGEAAMRALFAQSDVVVTWGLADLRAFLPPEGARRPRVVAVAHGGTGLTWTWDVMRAIAPQVDAFAAVSVEAARVVPEGRPCTVILNAPNPERSVVTRSREETRRDLGLAPEDVAVLYVGRLADEKRIPLLVEAVRFLPPAFRLVLVGDGTHAADADAAIARHGLAGRVIRAGARTDTGDCYHAADLLVLASKSEGAALVVFEAMAAGLPVISTATGLVKDDPGLVRTVPVEAGPQGWAAAIEGDWLDAEGRTARARRSLRALVERYGIEAHADAWAALVRSLAPAAPEASPATPAAPRGSQTPRTARQPDGPMRAAQACDYRVPLSTVEQSACGCGGRGMAICTARRSRREDQRVSLSECVACVAAS